MVDAPVLAGFAVLLTAALVRDVDAWLVIAGQTLVHAEWWRDPTSLQGSPLAELTPFLYSAFYWLVGQMTRVVSAVTATKVVFGLEIAALVFATFWLAVTLTGSRAAAYLSLLLLLPYQALEMALADTDRLGRLPFPGTMALPLALCGFALLARKRPVAAFAATGFAFDFHGAYGLSATAMLAGMLAWDLRGYRWPARLREGVRCAAVWVAAASPVLLWIVLSRPPTTGLLSQDVWLAWMRARSAGHAFPLAWDAGTYLQFLAWIALLYVSLGALPRRRRGAVIVGVATVGVLCAVSAVFSEWRPVPAIISLTLLRSTLFVVIFAAIAFAARIVHSEQSSGMARAAGIAVLIPAAAGWVGGMFLGAGWLGLTAARPPRWSGGFSVALLWIGLGLLSLWSTAPSLGMLAAAATGVALWAGAAAAWPDRQFVAGVAAAAVALTVSAYAGAFHVPPPYPDATIRDARTVVEWATLHTTSGTALIVPPDFGGTGAWTGIAVRPIFTAWGDMSVVYSSHQGQDTLARVAEFVDPSRYHSPGALRTALGEGYDAWTAADFQRVMRRWGPQYAVVDPTIPLPFARVLETPTFHVLDLTTMVSDVSYDPVTVKNRGFEAVHGERWDGWSTLHAATRPGPIRSGNHAACVESTADGGGWIFSGAGAFGLPPADSDEDPAVATYRVTAWVATLPGTALEEPAALAYVETYDADRRARLTSIGTALGEPGVFQRITGYFKTAAPGPRYRLAFRAAAAGSAVCVDDVSVDSVRVTPLNPAR